MTRKCLRIAVVDDHEILREGLRYAIEATGDFVVVAEASSGDQAFEQCLRLRPDAVIADVSMPGMPVCDLIRQLRAIPGSPSVLVFTTYASDAKIVELIEAGAKGFVLKDGGRSELMHALRAVANGQSWLHPIAQNALIAHTQLREAIDSLTPREHSVLMLITQGRSNKAIAGECRLTEGTVKGYVSQIFQKLQVTDRTGAAMHAVRRGWVELGNLHANANAARDHHI